MTLGVATSLGRESSIRTRCLPPFGRVALAPRKANLIYGELNCGGLGE
jgi:hypothetical protein